MPNATSTKSRTRATQTSEGRGIVIGVIAWVAATLVVTAALFVVIAFMQGEWAWPDAKKNPDWIRVVLLNTLPTAGILAGAAAVAITIRRQKTAEATLRISSAQLDHVLKEAEAATGRSEQLLDREQISGLRERFATSARQLGDEGVPVQLAGIYSLSAVADDWIVRGNRVEAQTCIHLLCAFLKTSSNSVIRKANFQVIAQRLSGETAPWLGLEFDLSGIEFGNNDNVDLRDVHLGSATHLNFSNARMTGGRIDLSRITVDGGRLNFRSARLERGAILFGGARFREGEVSFRRAHFGNSMRVALTPREFRKGVVSMFYTRGNVPNLIVPLNEADLLAKRARRSGTPRE